MENNIDFLQHNQAAWNEQASQQQEWSKPVTTEQTKAAKLGDWEVHLTPSPLDKKWLGEISGKKILCLASAGGQQAPILAAAGGIVTVFDLSDEQLKMDEMVAQRDGISLETVRGDMTDLSVFADDSFDIVFHPISNHYVEHVEKVWSESYRVLRKGGILLASFFNPVVFVADRNPEDRKNGIMRPKYKLPYADIKDLSQTEIEGKLERNEALVFGHSLQSLLGGQMKAGFVITDYFEEDQPNPRFLIDEFLPTFIATRALKM